MQTGEYECAVSAERLTEMQSAGREAGYCLHQQLISAVAVMLYRYSGQTQIFLTLGANTEARRKSGAIPGDCANLLPVFLTIDPQLNMAETIMKHQPAISAALAKPSFNYQCLLNAVRDDKETLFTDAPQIIFHWLNQDIGNGRQDDSRWRQASALFTGINADLIFICGYRGRQPNLKIVFNSRRFLLQTIGRMAEHLCSLLKSAMVTPDLPVDRLALSSEEEKTQLIRRWNRLQKPPPPQPPIHQTIALHAVQQPDKTALLTDHERLSYARLEQTANQLARYLNSRTLDSGDFIGIHMSPSIAAATAILAIFKIGAVAVPLDPMYPAERLFQMCSAGNIKIILAQRSLGAVHFAGHEVIYLDDLQPQIDRYPADSWMSAVQPDDLAVIFFTSGSTGAPKGVMLEHRALSDQSIWRERTDLVSATDVVLHSRPLGFVVCVSELLSPLGAGATVAIPAAAQTNDTARFIDFIQRHRISNAAIPPSRLHMLLHDPDFRRCAGLRLITCGGEEMTPQIVREVRRIFPGTRLVHTYGLTETTACLANWSGKLAAGAKTVPIGKPTCNAQLFLLDAYMQPVPVGVPGEIYAASSRLARGYLNDAGLTRRRFLKNPFSADPSERLYRTGDYAYRLADGNLVYLGRADRQVNFRGFRIELAEIESAVISQGNIKACAIVAEKTPAPTAEPRLIAYLVAKDNETLCIDALRRNLSRRLARFMLPSAYIILDEIPLNANGKLDSGRLPKPDDLQRQSRRDFADSRDTLESQLTEIWEQVLATSPIAAHDDFFVLGGHSLHAIRLASRIEERLGKTIPLDTLFQNPSIAQLAAILRETTDAAMP